MPRSGPLVDRQRLEHMLQAASDAVAISANRQRSDMDSDILLRHALVHCVQLIGEAAARIGDVGRAKVPELPWPQIVGMRHILVHDYFKIDHDAVWRVVTEHIPAMIPVLRSALARWPAQDAS
jgi:uncharacterized protein with HEPN domain